jgi:hypothetical protein
MAKKGSLISTIGNFFITFTQRARDKKGRWPSRKEDAWTITIG